MTGTDQPGTESGEGSEAGAADVRREWVGRDAFVVHSPHRTQAGAPDAPLIIFGHDAAETASFTAQATTVNAAAVRSLAGLRDLIEDRETLGTFAMSRPGQTGEAAEALALARELAGEGHLRIYGAWTTAVARAVQRAVEADAHGVVLPDSDAEEMFAYIFDLLVRLQEGEAPPVTREGMEEGLRVAFPTSPFWTRPPDSFVEETW